MTGFLPRAAIAATILVVFAAPASAQGDLAGLRAQYRRPAEIPFPQSNPYTPETHLQQLERAHIG